MMKLSRTFCVIAAASLCMAMAAFYSNEGATGANANYSSKGRNIIQYMKDIGVASADIYANHYNKIRHQNTSA